MHTTSIGPWRFHHNGSLDGDVLITRVDDTPIVVDGEARIPGVALAEFIGSWLNQERIAELEGQTGLDALGIAGYGRLAELARVRESCPADPTDEPETDR